jgi:hypothetical protein
VRAISRTVPRFLRPWLGQEDEHICELPARNSRGQSWCSLVLAARTSVLPGRRLRRAASWGRMPTQGAKLPIDAQRPVRRVFRRPDVGDPRNCSKSSQRCCTEAGSHVPTSGSPAGILGTAGSITIRRSDRSADCISVRRKPTAGPIPRGANCDSVFPGQSTRSKHHAIAKCDLRAGIVKARRPRARAGGAKRRALHDAEHRSSIGSVMVGASNEVQVAALIRAYKRATIVFAAYAGSVA